jgi:hypothetical protein
MPDASRQRSRVNRQRSVVSAERLSVRRWLLRTNVMHVAKSGPATMGSTKKTPAPPFDGPQSQLCGYGAYLGLRAEYVEGLIA